MLDLMTWYYTKKSDKTICIITAPQLSEHEGVRYGYMGRGTYKKKCLLGLTLYYWENTEYMYMY